MPKIATHGHTNKSIGAVPKASISDILVKQSSKTRLPQLIKHTKEGNVPVIKHLPMIYRLLLRFLLRYSSHGLSHKFSFQIRAMLSYL
jgi:hypothetical protein